MTVKVKAKARSKILAAVHETAGYLHKAGFIDKLRNAKVGSSTLLAGTNI